MKKLLLISLIIISCKNKNHLTAQQRDDLANSEASSYDNLERINLSTQFQTYNDTAVSYSMMSHKSLGVIYKTYHYDQNFKLRFLTENLYRDSMSREADRSKILSFTKFQYHFLDDELFKITEKIYQSGNVIDRTDYYVKHKSVFYKKGAQDIDPKEVVLKEEEPSIFNEILNKHIRNATGDIRTQKP